MPNKIQAIKLMREYTSDTGMQADEHSNLRLSLLDAKNIADKLQEAGVVFEDSRPVAEIPRITEADLDEYFQVRTDATEVHNIYMRLQERADTRYNQKRELEDKQYSLTKRLTARQQ